MKFYSAKNVKQEDMVKVLAKEILDLNNKLLFASEDSMRKLERIQTRLFNNNNNNENQIEFVKENDKKIKRIEKRLSIFYKIFEIITEEGNKNEINSNKKTV
tara:strand:- start:3875 stop:4180 length:306 start_codon:yes stop_codon:yes gene_type:complete